MTDKLPAEERQRRLSEGQRLAWARRKMKHDGYRPMWFVQLARDRNILQVAMDYVMTKRGSLDRSEELQNADHDLLQFCLADWRNTACDFDNAVKNLIQKAIDL